VEASGAFGRIRAHAAIITVSTGVLAQSGIAFTPGLPAQTLDAIKALPLGGYISMAGMFPPGTSRAKSGSRGFFGKLVQDARDASAESALYGTPDEICAKLEKLQAMQPDWLIGQHLVAGPPQVQPVLQRQRDYLCGILGHAWHRLELGQSEAEGVQGLVPPVHWPQPEAGLAPAWRQQHLFNQRRAWREAEQLWLDRKPLPLTCGSAPDVRR
jgi:hypothetical protein